METNTALKKKPNASTAAATGLAQQRPVTGPPAPNSDIIFFINASFRYEFEKCAELTKEEHDVISFEADLVKKLNDGNTLSYITSLRVPRGCMVRAKMHPVFRRMLVQSMWLQMQPAMLRYKGNGIPIDPKTPVCLCANPPCNNSAVRFVGNPGFFPKKNMLIDPFCVPVCQEAACVLQAQQMSNTIHAQSSDQQLAQQQAQQQQYLSSGQSPSGIENPFAIASNPALATQMPKSVKSCNMCGSFEQKYGGTAQILRACPLCNIANYCSQQCQIQDWQRGHKDVCVNAQGKGTASTAANAKAAAVKKAAPATIPEEGAPAPAPSPMPITLAPAPAPAPMPMAAPAPAPAPMPIASQQQQQLTQAMAAMPMPSYKMVEPAAVAVPSSSAPAYAMPKYNMTGGQQPGGSSTAVPAYNPSPNFQAPKAAAAAGTTPASSASMPIKKGRKKAE